MRYNVPGVKGALHERKFGHAHEGFYAIYLNEDTRLSSRRPLSFYTHFKTPLLLYFFEEISRSLRSNVLHFPLNVCATPPQIRKKVIIFPI